MCNLPWPLVVGKTKGSILDGFGSGRFWAVNVDLLSDLKMLLPGCMALAKL